MHGGFRSKSQNRPFEERERQWLSSKSGNLSLEDHKDVKLHGKTTDNGDLTGKNGI